ncbi:hypothetical protein BKI52_00960 [marine bacterium AO1-C]|nr:hypothetical protein BKI52_00960 [marine bacterium AO1-C]
MKKTIHCMVVDDEPLAIGLLEKHIQQFSQLNLVASCWNAVQALEVLNQEKIDLLFLDIQMPGLTGLEFAQSLQNPPEIIFTTAYRDYAVESYELNVIDYLVKPITFNRFFKAVNKYFDKVAIQPVNTPPISITKAPSPPSNEDNSFIYVNTNRKYTKVLFEEVLYIESIKDYIQIHTEREPVMTKEKISEFTDQLPAYFLRIHRSYIVNTKKITAFTQQDIEINQLEIPIGISYKQEVLKFLKKN